MRSTWPDLVSGIILITASCAHEPGPSAAGALEWMAGCWATELNSVSIEEQWMAPRGGILLGVSRTTDDEALVGFEFMRIEIESDTLLTFIALPSAQTQTEFRGRLSDRGFVTENLAHDFPQRVSYQAVGHDSLVARIEGVDAGQPRGLELAYVRVRCPTGLPGDGSQLTDPHKDSSDVSPDRAPRGVVPEPGRPGR